MFWGFLLIMALAATFCVFAFSLWSMPVLLLVAALGRIEAAGWLGGAIRFLAWPVAAFAALWQLAFWAAWAAFCAGTDHKYAVSPHTSTPWLYYAIALLAVASPLQYLFSTESGARGGDGSAGFVWGSFGYLAATVVLFGAFCFLLR